MKGLEPDIPDVNPSMKELLELSSISMIILSEKGIVLYANPEATELFGVDNEILGSGFEELFFTDSVTDTKKLLKEALNGRSVQKEQILKIKHKKNEAIWSEIKISALKTLPAKNVLLCQIKNISELKDYEEKIAGQSRLLLDLINAIPNNVYIKNLTGEFLLANVLMSKLAGADDSQKLLGKTDFDFFPKKLAKKYYQDEQEIIKTGKAKINIIEQVVESNNDRKWYSTSKFPLKNNEGEIIGIMGIGRDITTWVKEQKALRKAKIKAERADQLKSAFLANLSHEIRTPLNGILGFSQFLKHSIPKDDKNQKYIDFILANGKQLLHQIIDIIDISKIDSGQFPIYKKNFILNEIMHELEYSFNEKMRQLGLKDINLFLEMGLTDKDSGIYSDDQKIKQVLSNFLNNALKFTHHGDIHFGYKLEEKNIRFFVKDTGIGISSENIKSIFERFHQVDFSLSRKYEGAGLGLAIADGIVRLLGGEIGANSELNNGSEFYFTIPYKKADLATGRPEDVSDNKLKNKRVVVVDDSEQSYEQMEIILFQNEIEVLHAKNQNSFYESISNRTQKVDAVILNMKTKWLNNCPSIQKIKSINSRVSVLLIAKELDKLQREECMAAGADAYITESVIHEKLIKVLRTLFS